MNIEMLIKLLLVLVAVQCDSVLKNNLRFLNENHQNICDDNQIDSAFNDEKHGIQMTRNDWVFTYNEKEKKLEKPQKQNSSKAYLIQTKVYLSQTPECESSDNICSDILRAKNLIIILYKERNANFTGSYEVRKVVNGVIANIDDNAILPFGLERNGNIYSRGQSFWPRELNLYKKQLNKNRTAMVYNPKNYKFLIIVNGESKEGSKLLWNKLDPHKSWSNQWKSETFDNSMIYIGMFFMDNNVYVFGINDFFSKVFINSDDNELKDTRLNIQQFIGCSQKTRFKRNAINAYTKTTIDDYSSIILIVVVLVLIILFVLVIGIGFLFCCRKKTCSEPVKEERKFGDLDSNLNLNLTVSQVSVAEEQINPKSKQTTSQDIISFFEDKKRKKKRQS